MPSVSTDKLLYPINRITRDLQNLSINPECVSYFEILIQQYILYKNVISTLFLVCHLMKRKLAFEIILIKQVLFHDMLQGKDFAS